MAAHWSKDAIGVLEALTKEPGWACVHLLDLGRRNGPRGIYYRNVGSEWRVTVDLSRPSEAHLTDAIGVVLAAGRAHAGSPSFSVTATGRRWAPKPNRHDIIDRNFG
jgi:hypothetical protein